MNAQTLIEALPALIRPDVAGRTRATIQLELTGDGGGQWWVRPPTTSGSGWASSIR